MQGLSNMILLRSEAAKMTGEPANALSLTEIPSKIPAEGYYQSYCVDPKDPINKGALSKAKIKIFQRSGTLTPRSILNIKDVVKVVQEYTTYPVEVVTTTEKVSIRDQIKLFNSFDVLVTVHGSHLTNGLFSMHPHTKAVLELGSFVYDPIFHKNYVYNLNFAEYVISSGHLTPSISAINSPDITKSHHCYFREYNDFSKKNCKLERKYDPAIPSKVAQMWWICPLNLHTRHCDTIVNTTILRDHLNLLFKNSLCRKKLNVTWAPTDVFSEVVQLPPTRTTK